MRNVSIELTAEYQSVGLASVKLIVPHLSYTDIVSTIFLLGFCQPHSVKFSLHSFKVGKVSITRDYLLCSPEEDNLRSWEARIDTLDVH